MLPTEVDACRHWEDTDNYLNLDQLRDSKKNPDFSHGHGGYHRQNWLNSPGTESVKNHGRLLFPLTHYKGLRFIARKVEGK